MEKIFFTSDLHFCHDREFIWKPRGFNSISEMNDAIVDNFNKVVNDLDDLYILGDLMLKNDEQGKQLLDMLPGRKHIIIGNHDTLNRQAKYPSIRGFVDIKWADMINYRGYHFYLSHFPTMTGNLEHESLKQMTLNLSGHTHSKDKFYQDLPYVYNVSVDAHDCYPVSIDQIIEDMKAKVEECKGDVIMTFEEFVAKHQHGDPEPFCPFSIGYCNDAYSSACYQCEIAREKYKRNDTTGSL